MNKRIHHERHQPSFRKNKGLLEKHKDYVLRARDFHSKEDRLKALEQKAAERNPDEFYYQMINSKTQNGIHVLDRPNSSPFTASEIKKLKSQDLLFIQTALQKEKKKIEKLEGQLNDIKQLESARQKRKRNVELDPVMADFYKHHDNGFKSSLDARKHIEFSDSDSDSELESDVSSFVRKTKTLDPLKIPDNRVEITPIPALPSNKTIKDIIKGQSKHYRILQERYVRRDYLQAMYDDILNQKKLMSKGGKVKKVKSRIPGDIKSRDVYQWEFRRKR